jgi:hypothetical protein
MLARLGKRPTDLSFLERIASADPFFAEAWTGRFERSIRRNAGIPTVLPAVQRFATRIPECSASA